MKKSILAVAGVAAFAGIAMPVAGAFATADFTDTLDVTITNNCAFTRGTTAHVGGDSSKGTWSTTGDVLSGTFTAGELDSDFGKSNFHVVCNNLKGWEVTATATALQGQGTISSESIAVGTPAANASAWSYTSSKGDDTDTTFTVGGKNAASIAKMTKATDTAGKDFTVAYAVSVSQTQAAGEYKGTIAYTFAQLQ